MELKSDATGQAVVPVLACVLDQLCARNDALPHDNKAANKFHALRAPAISIKEYLTRIARYAACSGECFVLALVYIDRIIQSNPAFVVNSLNIHRLLITSIMLAAKFFDDQYYNNAYFAKVGGVPCHEMNNLEVEFLFMANFTLFVTTAKYSQYYLELCNHAMNSACGCSDEPVPDLVIPPLMHHKHLEIPSDWQEILNRRREDRQGGNKASQVPQPNAHEIPPFVFHLEDPGHNQQQQQQQQQQVAPAHDSSRMSITSDSLVTNSFLDEMEEETPQYESPFQNIRENSSSRSDHDYRSAPLADNNADRKTEPGFDAYLTYPQTSQNSNNAGGYSPQESLISRSISRSTSNNSQNSSLKRHAPTRSPSQSSQQHSGLSQAFMT